MLRLSRSSGSWHSWVWRAATAVALLAQCWIAAAPLAEGRGFGAPAHVEAAGISKHFAHDAADCPACAVLALQSLVATHDLPTATPGARPALVAALPVALPESSPRLLSRSRAPPVTH